MLEQRPEARSVREARGLRDIAEHDRQELARLASLGRIGRIRDCGADFRELPHDRALANDLGVAAAFVYKRRVDGSEPHVTGVSPVFVTMAVLNQAVWIVWGLLVRDAGTIMTASTVCGLTSFNLLWYGMRRLGLRAFFPHETLAALPVVAVGEP